MALQIYARDPLHSDGPSNFDLTLDFFELSAARIYLESPRTPINTVEKMNRSQLEPSKFAQFHPSAHHIRQSVL